MNFATGPAVADHDFAVAWIDHMKSVYQRVIDRHSQEAGMNPADIVKARNHLKALAVIEETIREHHEMANGRAYPGGRSRPVALNLRTVATLILPDGSRREIPRR